MNLYQKQAPFSHAVADRFGKGRHHAATLYSHWFKTGEIDREWVEPQARPLVEAMIDAIDWSLPPVVNQLKDGETTKFLLKMADGLETESVVIPMKSGGTLCISSQVGCKMGCSFCETGRMGLIRSLTVQEIVVQVFVARFRLHAPVRNIVFMGMGEPFDNFDHVMTAIEVLTDPAGLAFGPSRITVSTSGHVDAIDRFAEVADPALNLAISVNAPTDAIRNRIMPVNRRWNMEALKQSMVRYCAHPRRVILVEYVLLQGINDSVESAHQLADYLADLRVKINLIPYNSQRKSRYSPPELEAQQLFSDVLRSRGFQVLLRHHKGRGIMAACGQLGNIRIVGK